MPEQQEHFPQEPDRIAWKALLLILVVAVAIGTASVWWSWTMANDVEADEYVGRRVVSDQHILPDRMYVETGSIGGVGSAELLDTRWLDRERGIAMIPIDDAIEAYLLRAREERP